MNLLRLEMPLCEYRSKAAAIYGGKYFLHDQCASDLSLYRDILGAGLFRHVSSRSTTLRGNVAFFEYFFRCGSSFVAQQDRIW
jgi:hypothetical protein